MYVFYQIGISIGMIVVAFAIHILRQAINGNSLFIMFNYLFALSISIGGIFIIVASLAAMQPQNWYTSSPLGKILLLFYSTITSLIIQANTIFNVKKLTTY